MNHQQRKTKRDKDATKPTTLTRLDRLKIWGVISLIIAAVFWFRVLYDQALCSKSLERTLTRWRTTYHLNEAQLNRIREIESAFHGNGNFMTKPEHTIEETTNHHQKIASVMNPEDGANFLLHLKKH
jgi:hypothetical protein